VKLTKIDAAEANLCAAIRLFFADEHPVPVHTLAGAAREVMSVLGEKLETNILLDQLAESRGVSPREYLRKATVALNFMKHADRDPTAVLEFADEANDFMLFWACRDFVSITKGLPIEAQVFDAWFFATQVKEVNKGGLRWQESVKACSRLFPGVRSASRPEQKRIAYKVLGDALKKPALRMQIERTIRLPSSPSQ
jgi:hypothetical protein